MPEWLKPVIVSRAEWGCPDGQESPRGEPAYTPVSHIIIHHTATSNDAPRWDAVVRSIWNFHVFANGWKDIGYNYLIDQRGTIYEGRAGEDSGPPGQDVVGAHFICANTHTIGVAIIGTFNAKDLPPFQQTALEDLLTWKCSQRMIDPLGSSFHLTSQLLLRHISGHRDGNHAIPDSGACPRNTECPGQQLYRLLPLICQRISERIDAIDVNRGDQTEK